MNDLYDTTVISERRFASSRVELFGLAAGDGAPIVFLHGITASAYVWTPVLEELAGSGRCVALDQRGHGRSGHPDGSTCDADELSDDVVDVIEALDAGPAVVVGHSLGGRNALTLAHRSPDHVRAIVSVEFNPFIEPEVLDRLEERVNAGARAFESLDEVKDYLRGRYPLLPEDAIDRRATYGYALRGDEIWPLADPAAMAATAAGLRGDVTEATRDLACPALLVRGAKSTFVSEAAFARTQDLRPDLLYQVVEGSDHYVPEIRSRETVRLIAEFIDRMS